MPGFELVGKEERDAVLAVFDQQNGVLFRHGFDVLRKGHFKVVEFEKAFATHVGAKYAVAVTSGTAALKVALKAAGVGPGDEVITQAFTFIATVEAICDCGAVPVLTNVDKTLNMDPADLQRKITSKTKAIMPVHMLGVAADMDPILELAARKGIAVVEDNCESLGAQYGGHFLGTVGRVGTYSFDFGKVITTGEGGMVTTDDEQLYRRAKEYHDHGHESNPAVPRGRDTRTLYGFNFRMNELQGAIGLAQLKKLDGICEVNRRNHGWMMAGLRDVRGLEFRTIPKKCKDLCDTIIFFVSSADIAREFVARMTKAGLGTKNLPDAYDWHFAGTWDHIFKHYGLDSAALQRATQPTQDLLARSIALPIMLKYDQAKIAEIVGKLREIAGQLL